MEHGDKDGYIGCYVVRKDYRGNGVGRLLFDKAIKRLDGRNIALCSEPFMYKKYMNNGFGVAADYGLGVSSGSIDFKTMVQMEDYLANCPVRVQFAEPPDLGESAFKNVLIYDQVAAGRERRQWCKSLLLHHEENESLIAVDGGDEQRIRGYATISDIGEDRLRIGPVYADTPEIAKALVFNLLVSYDEDLAEYDVRMFCMYPNESRRQHCLTDSLGLKVPWEMKHLFTKRLPNFDRQKVYCLADLDVNLI